MSFPNVKLRPGLERLSEAACADDRLDSAIGSMTRADFEEAEAEEMDAGAGADKLEVMAEEQDDSPSELRADLDKWRGRSSDDSMRMDSAYVSMDTALEPVQTAASEAMSLMAELNISSPPAFHAGVRSALGSSVRRALVTLAGVSEADNGDEDEKRCRTQVASALNAFQQNTTCHNFACSGDERYLLASFRTLLFSPNEDGDTALHIAVINFQVKAVGQILSVLPSVSCLDLANKLGQTPLHLAVITNQPVLVKVFVQHGAHVTKVDRRGNTALHLAAQNGAKECAHFLLTAHPDGKWRTARADTEGRNYNGMTALHVAVLNGHQEVVRLLVSNGADVDCQDLTCGRSPLHHAVESDKLAIASVLLFEFNANVNAQTFDGNVALHTAAGRNIAPMVALLIAAGANLELRNGEGDLPQDLTKDKSTLDVFQRVQQQQQR